MNSQGTPPSGLASYLISLNTFTDKLALLEEENDVLRAEVAHEKAKPIALYACIFGATLAAFFAGLTLAIR